MIESDRSKWKTTTAAAWRDQYSRNSCLISINANNWNNAVSLIKFHHRQKASILPQISVTGCTFHMPFPNFLKEHTWRLLYGTVAVGSAMLNVKEQIRQLTDEKKSIAPASLSAAQINCSTVAIRSHCRIYYSYWQWCWLWWIWLRLTSLSRQ